MEKLLGDYPIFEGIDTESFFEHYTKNNYHVLKHGEYLFHQNDEAHGLYIVIEGELDIILEGRNGSTTNLATLGPGSPIGEMSILTKGVRTTSVVAKSDAKLLYLDLKDFSSGVGENELFTLRLGCNIAKILSKRLSICLDMINDMEKASDKKYIGSEISMFREKLVSGGLF